jgi:hypothetical protein
MTAVDLVTALYDRVAESLHRSRVRSEVDHDMAIRGL